jgi:hypothetical protein
VHLFCRSTHIIKDQCRWVSRMCGESAHVHFKVTKIRFNAYACIIHLLVLLYTLECMLASVHKELMLSVGAGVHDTWESVQSISM